MDKLKCNKTYFLQYDYRNYGKKYTLDLILAEIYDGT